VLVIIGLIVGGVLVGRDLVKAAQVRNYISTIESLKTAVNTFRGKYNCLPGDCANGTTFFTATHNGDGDGIYDTDSNTSFNSWSSEITEANNQLALAGLIKLAPFDRTDGTVMDVSKGWLNLKSNTGLFLVSDSGINYVRVGGGQQYPGDHGTWISLNGSGATPIEAWTIDNKLDDGLPRSGSIINRTELDSFAYTGECSNASAYDLITYTTSTQCGLMIKAGF